MKRRLESLEYYRYECEETFYFSWLLEEEDTGLPVKIMVDEGYAYRMYKHPLWIYFKNGYDKDAELVPLVVCDDPYIPYNIPLQIFRKDFYDVYYFVKENQEKLRLIANKKYDIDDFIEDWYEDLSINESLSLQLNEMANIKPKYSGLPYELWLDGGKSFEKSGHYMRIKFQYPTTKNYSKGNSVTITLPDMEIKPKNKKVPNEVIRQIIGFIKVNEENIMKVLKDGLNPKKVLIPFIIKVDSKGNPIQDDKEPEFYKVSNGGCGYTIVKNKEDKFNYIDANGNILSKKWFDVAQPFNERSGKMLAFVKIGVTEYWLSTNGGLKPVEY